MHLISREESVFFSSRCCCQVTVLLLSSTTTRLYADYLPIYAAPPYLAGVGGYLIPVNPAPPTGENGPPIGTASRYDGSELTGERVLRWNSSNSTFNELDVISHSLSGQAFTWAY